MTKVLVVMLLAVVVVMTVLWAFGKAIWWLRVTFPPNRSSRRGPGRRP